MSFDFLFKNIEVKDLQEKVVKGDRYIIHYTIPFFRSQNAINKTIRELSVKPEYKLIRSEIIRHEGMLEHDILLIEIEIRENPIPLAVIAYGVVAIAAASLLYMSLDKVYKVVSTVPKPVLIVGLVGVILISLRKWRFV